MTTQKRYITKYHLQCMLQTQQTIPHKYDVHTYYGECMLIQEEQTALFLKDFVNDTVIILPEHYDLVQNLLFVLRHSGCKKIKKFLPKSIKKFDKMLIAQRERIAMADRVKPTNLNTPGANKFSILANKKKMLMMSCTDICALGDAINNEHDFNITKIKNKFASFVSYRIDLVLMGKMPIDIDFPILLQKYGTDRQTRAYKNIISNKTRLRQPAKTQSMPSNTQKTTHKISVFEGNYDDYKRKSAALRHARDVKIATEERQIKNLSEFVARANAASPTNHSIKRVGKTREKILKKILENRTLREQTYKKVKMDLSPRTNGATHPIHVDDLWFRFPGARLLYRKLSFYITGGERFLIVGENGTGKSTLLKLIMGLYTPERGTISINPKTDIAYYAQELELLDKDKTILENVSSDEYTELQLRSVLANFLFYDTDVFKKLSVLSPGEQARVALCKMLLKRANMLILDEPTNHLDPDTQRIIGDNFHDFPGTIIAVSHNPDFVEQIGITRMLTLPDGHIRDYDHDLLEYYYNINTTKN